MQTTKDIFSTEELEARDLAILYEITGYQGDSPPDDSEFWVHYANFKVLAA